MNVKKRYLKYNNKKNEISNKHKLVKNKATKNFTKAKTKFTSKKIINKKFYSKNKYKFYSFKKKLNRFKSSSKNNKGTKISNIYKYFLIFALLLLYFVIYLYYERYDIIIDHPIKVGYYCNSIRYGGVERVMALLINLLSKEKYLDIYLITSYGKLEGEYRIPNNTKRIYLSEQKKNLYEIIEQEQIDIIIYNFYSKNDIERLNSLNKTKAIIYNHSSFLYWIFLRKYKFSKTPYPAYQKSKYVISLIPVENDYLFKKWGINSILMDNPTTFDYNSVIPSDLSSKTIVMIGRIEDPVKRYDLGIRAMQNIIKEIPDCQMKIISSKNRKFKNLITSLHLEKNVKFTGFNKHTEIYLKNASLHIFPSLSEGYPMVLGEAKIFGIPTIICGLDYLALAKGGTVIIYDDNPDTIAKEAINILKNETYRKQLGREARESMKMHQNKLIAKKWINLLLSVYKGDDESYKKLNSHNIMTEQEADVILNNQLNLLKIRYHHLNRLTLENLKSYSF